MWQKSLLLIQFTRQGWKWGYKELTEIVKQGKVSEIVVDELSRLGRNTYDTIGTLRFVDEYNVNVVVRNMGNLQSTIDGKKNPVWNLITGVMSSLFEMERENILERTEMERKMYVLNGGKLGRTRGSNENIHTFLNKPKTQSIIKYLKWANQLGIFLLVWEYQHLLFIK